MRTSVKDLYKSAYGKMALGAFNVFNAEQLHGLMRGAQLAGLPVLVQFTPVARNYMHPEMLNGMINAVAKIYPAVRFAVHLDHGNFEHCISAIESGYYDSVMIDASHESYEENIRITSEIVQRAHQVGIAVEAELGVLSGVEDDITVENDKAFYTDPNQAKDFVSRTGCDSLAVAVGTSHGAYKFSGNQGLRLDILTEIQQKLPGFPIVLHGASAVSANEVESINLSGGNLKQDAQGVDVSQLKKAISLGVCKVNIATDMRLIWTRVHREFFRDFPEQFDPVVPGKTFMLEMEKMVYEKCMNLKIV
ncbi:MAG: class II fructose-bisphosphate aldolase [Bacteroidales bacterium]|nr:class II fructose-bisphosphate aldolase [Bacteroidales bacterium]